MSKCSHERVNEGNLGDEEYVVECSNCGEDLTSVYCPAEESSHAHARCDCGHTLNEHGIDEEYVKHGGEHQECNQCSCIRFVPDCPTCGTNTLPESDLINMLLGVMDSLVRDLLVSRKLIATLRTQLAEAEVSYKGTVKLLQELQRGYDSLFHKNADAERKGWNDAIEAVLRLLGETQISYLRNLAMQKITILTKKGE